MNATAFLDRLKRARGYQKQIVHVENIPPREAFAGELNGTLHPTLRGTLENKGLWPLYSHQAQAIDALKDGENVIVATPAASGKSLCYNLAVLDSLLANKATKAVYIYPTKALAQDQLKGLRDLGEGLSESGKLPFNAAIFDGDTPLDERSSIKRSAQILLTNPDMLHLGILPNHKTWSRFLQGLRYVVLDESHVYRGVFGSHVSNVIRRLRRICRTYGSSPQFVLCSATIANPGELAERLTGLPLCVIDQDGAPYGGKQFAFWNPPIVDTAKSTRRSTNSEAATLFSELVSRRIRTITFVRTRRVAELVYLYARDQLKEKRPGLASRISSYRASYLPEDRRQIEKALFNGELMGVATTNALELGIDVGHLDATVITGYPGSISSAWQQAGRSGRRRDESLSILVGQDNPLDQYLMNHPEAFFGRPVESALLSPENPHVLLPHILCAAYESPLTHHDADLFGPGFAKSLEDLEDRRLVRGSGGKWYITTDVAYPAEEVKIRSTSPHNYVVVDEGSGVVLETVDEASAYYQLYPGAVYLHRGEPYLVNRLDPVSRRAYVVPNDGAYYTDARDVTDIRIRGVRQTRTAGGVEVYMGDVEVTNQVLGFKKKVPFTEATISEEYLDLPPQRFNTVALWFDVPDDFLKGVREARADLAGGLHAGEHAAIGVLPLFALCDRNDIGGVSTPLHPDTRKPQVFIYDGHPGGIGIAERGYQVIEDLWSATLRVISECPCNDGCPSCIQSPKCGNNNHPLDKEVAILMLRALCLKC
ncbi:MAG: DEAD/DEAH box helicase [Dehalococcoidia bacterium]|nr:DEAD/DEAH box helicase [Dehalococcoidia bacterium]